MGNNLGIATNILKTLETSSSVGMFARDTGGCLISKLALSRSKDEAREISIAEIAESALFYFSAPALARSTAGHFAKKYNLEKDILTTPIKELKANKDTLKKVKLGKFGQIFTTFGVILPAVFAIAPVRNYITQGNTGKDEFISVVGLEDKKQDEKKKEAKEKSISLIKKLALAAAGAVALGNGIASFASKSDKFYKKAEPIIDKTIKNFDFTKKGDLEMLHYGALIYPVSIASYLWASRDKYERQENLRRFSVTVPLMFFGEKLIEKPIHKFFDKHFNTNIMDNNGIKSYKEILKMPVDLQKKALKSKNWAYGLTFGINTMAIAAGIALLNRIKTKQNYNKDHKKQPLVMPKIEDIYKKAGFNYGQ